MGKFKKNCHNSGCMQESWFLVLYGFGGRPIERHDLNLTPDDPCCHGNEIGTKIIGYNSAYIRDIPKIGDEPLNDAR